MSNFIKIKTLQSLDGSYLLINSSYIKHLEFDIEEEFGLIFMSTGEKYKISISDFEKLISSLSKP